MDAILSASGPDVLHAWQTTLIGVFTAVGGLVWAALKAYTQFRSMKRAEDLQDAKARVEIAQAEALAAKAGVEEATAEVEADRIRRSSAPSLPGDRASSADLSNPPGKS